MNMLPNYLTQEQFDDLYLKCKEKMLLEQLPIEAIAEHEAFTRLKNEKLIAEDVYLGIDDVFDENNKLDSTFEKYVKDEKEKLKKTIEKGVLKETKVKDKAGWYHNGGEYIGKRAVTGESWYNYNKKLDIGYNELIDDKGKLIEFYEGEVAIAQGFSSRLSTKNKEQCWAESRRKDMIESIQKGLSVSVADKEIYFDETFAPMLQTLVKWTNDCIQTSVNHWEVLKRVQKDIFDDKIVLGTSIVEKAEDSINKPKEVMDSLLEGTKGTLKIFCLSDAPKLRDEDKLKIITEVEPDEDFVSEQIGWLIDLAERESGFRWKK
jgi:hypothetical protein